MLNISGSATAQYVSMNAQMGAVGGAVGARQQSVPAAAEAGGASGVSAVRNSTEVSLRSRDDAQALVMQSAVAGINEALEPVVGPNAIDKPMIEDNSAEVVAERIVMASTRAFEGYAAQQPAGTSQAQSVTGFADTLRSGLESGMREARDVLSGMNAYNAEVDASLQKTRELALQGFDRFVMQRLPSSDQQT